MFLIFTNGVLLKEKDADSLVGLRATYAYGKSWVNLAHNAKDYKILNLFEKYKLSLGKGAQPKNGLYRIEGDTEGAQKVVFLIETKPS